MTDVRKCIRTFSHTEHKAVIISEASHILETVREVFDMEERQASRQHKIILTNRGTCALSGITDILSFDVNEILLETDMGMLMIRGIDLHVNRLTLEKGEVDLSGKIDSLQYSDVAKGKNQNESFLGRLFK